MFTDIRRVYKERDPLETVALIRRILTDLELPVEETFHANPYPQVYSISLEMGGPGGFRANGKGRNADYCLASAYAELLERMQNGMYSSFSRSNQSLLHQDFGYYYCPDEYYLSRREFFSLPIEIMDDIVRHTGDARSSFLESYFERASNNNGHGVLAVPFYDTKRGATIQLPINLLLMTVGSNGMAAGNTRAEAIYQALCEVLERWGAARVFYDRLTPPTVPSSFLRRFREEFEIITEIERTGKYQVSIKDFSANLRIPALGVIIENREAHTYRLNVGSDTCFQVALSRCLTEVYQGFVDEEMIDQRLLEIPDKEPPYFDSEDEDALYQRYTVFGQFTRDNSGVFPPSLFGSHESYAFDPGVFREESSYELEIDRLVRYFHDAGHDVYVRDVSFMRFPSVFIYVPEVSALGRKNVRLQGRDEARAVFEWDGVEPMVFSLASRSTEELTLIAEALEGFPPGTPVSSLLNLKLKQDCDWAQLSAAFLLTQIWYRVGEIEKAVKAFGRFLSTRCDDIPYYKAIEKYLELRSQGHEKDTTLEKMAGEFGQEAIQVCEDLADPERVFDSVALPACPRCSICALRQDCLTAGQIAMSRVIYPLMEQGWVDQEGLAQAFSRALPA